MLDKAAESDSEATDKSFAWIVAGYDKTEMYMSFGLEKLTSALTGIAGEYYVVAELSRRGLMASITLRNNDSIDIHASHLISKKLFAIQVKTKQIKGFNGC